MIRNALAELEAWRLNERRKPMIVWGARQVGKTYLVKDIFAEKHYCGRYIYIDLRVEDDIRDYCEQHVSAKDIVEFIKVVKNRNIDAGTLLIFDEVQESPGVITALKYFCQDMREIPVIATGSMVRTRLQRLSRKRGASERQPFLFPVGKINQITVYPMTFDEFLMNSNVNLYKAVCVSYAEKKPLPAAVHRQALETVYRYLLVGGMPESVQTFLDTGSFFESRRILTELYDNYLADMELYQASPESIVRSRMIFKNVFTELNRESKDFRAAVIEPGSRTRDMRTPVDWLSMAQVVRKSFKLDERVTIPLTERSESDFRLFLGDTGMFVYQSGINASSFISGDANNTLSGVFFENYAANELAARGIGLYYWCGKRSAELEFIVESGGKIFPIDVKKSRGSLNSLEAFAQHNRFETAIKVSANNYGFNAERKLLTVPFYMLFLVADDLARGTLPPTEGE